MSLPKPWVVMLVLFGLALSTRLPSLGGFLTSDEINWIGRSRWFLVGLLTAEIDCPPAIDGRQTIARGLGCTLQTGHPGVTTMWAGSLGLLWHYGYVDPPAEDDLLKFLLELGSRREDIAVISSVRLPLAIVGSLFVPFFYWLVQRLMSQSVALIAGLLVALSPFQIALTRVIHHDSLTAIFMVLSVLALMGYWLRGWSWSWLVISAGLGGLALLSKQAGWFLPPFVGLLAGLTWLSGLRQPQSGRRLARLVSDGLLWGVVAAGTVVAFFPALWVNPVEVGQTVMGVSQRLAETGHSHYFLGQISQDPGPLFYPVGWLLQASPLEVLGLLGAGLAGLQVLTSRPALKEDDSGRPVIIALLLFVGALALFMMISDKKMVRYFLPAFPIIDIVVAIGLLWLMRQLAAVLTRPRPDLIGPVMTTLPLVIVATQGWYAYSSFPYYFTFYNPLFGGAAGAARWMTIMGWGEGLNEAAYYLNQQPEAKAATVVVEGNCGLYEPFFNGRTLCHNDKAGGLLAADYFVYYISLLQRDLYERAQQEFFIRHQTPIHRVTFGGLDYVLTYQTPIEHQVDRQANQLPEALTVLGYTLAGDGQLTLFWQNEGLGPQPLWLGLAPTSGVFAPGQSLPQTDRWWLLCRPKPDFVAEVDTAGAIIESGCALGAAGLRAGLYELQLAVGERTALRPLEQSRLGVIKIEPDGRFHQVDLVEPKPDDS